jgi:hypothetical protein
MGGWLTGMKGVGAGVRGSETPTGTIGVGASVACTWPALSLLPPMPTCEWQCRGGQPW